MLRILENRKILHLPLTIFLSCVVSACGGNSGESTSVDSNSEPTVEVQSPVVPVGEAISPEDQRIIPTSEVRAYRSDGPYAAVLKECVLIDFENACRLEILPYIGQVHADISIEHIMQRVVVSHDWMGSRFEQMLRRVPSDILGLFAPVTSIVIGSEVRPSSYSRSKGRIKLDPRYLWLSVPEKRTVSTNSDPRSEYGAALLFVRHSRSMIGDEYASNYYSLTDEQERTLENLDIPLARLLYHELAHANDYVQTDKLPELSLRLRPLDAADQLSEFSVSNLLYGELTLTAQRSYLYGLANVRYFNAEASDFEKSVLADFVGAEMENEGKMIFYSYSTPAEDTATLFTAAMIKFHYNVDTHVGFSNKPDTYPDASCNEFKVAWGVRNRIASPLVAPRAKFVVDKMLTPSAELDSFFANNLGQAIPLRVGDGWCDSRYLNQQLAKRKAAKGKVEQLEWTMVPDYK